MISASSPSAVAPSPAADQRATSGAFSAGSDFSMYLKMLTTQMQNQNPLNPVEAADFAVQLATFAGVEQQVQTNQLLGRLTEAAISGDLAAWLGADVAAGTTTTVDQSQIHLHLPAASSGTARRDVVFKTTAGQEVLRLPVAITQSSVFIDPGSDGATPLLPGSYRTEVEDFSGNDLLATSAAPQFLRVQEIQKTPTGSVLLLESGARIAPADVAALRKP